jgi:hypothetical protein
MRARRWKRSWLLTLLIYAVFAIALVPALYAVIITLAPNHTVEGHKTMPMGQAFLSIVIGPILALVPAFFLGRRRQAIT